MAQVVDEQIGVRTTVESERHFVQVGLQVLRADFVPRSDDSALEKRESCIITPISLDLHPSICNPNLLAFNLLNILANS